MSHDSCSESKDIEIDIGKPEVAKCLRITAMTAAEIKANPVPFNPFYVCLFFSFYFSVFDIFSDGFI